MLASITYLCAYAAQPEPRADQSIGLVVLRFVNKVLIRVARSVVLHAIIHTPIPFIIMARCDVAKPVA